MQIGVTIGNQAVQASGSVILGVGERSFVIQIEDLTYNLTFVNDTGESRGEITQNGPKGLIIHLFNWETPFGSSQHWTNIGTINGEQIGLRIFSQTIGEGESAHRLVNYTIVRGTPR